MAAFGESPCLLLEGFCMATLYHRGKSSPTQNSFFGGAFPGEVEPVFSGAAGCEPFSLRPCTQQALVSQTRTLGQRWAPRNALRQADRACERPRARPSQTNRGPIGASDGDAASFR